MMGTMSDEAKKSKNPFEPDPVIEYYKQGIDKSLLKENLKLSVTERFERHMALQRFAEELRRAGKEAKKRAR